MRRNRDDRVNADTAALFPHGCQGFQHGNTAGSSGLSRLPIRRSVVAASQSPGSSSSVQPCGTLRTQTPQKSFSLTLAARITQTAEKMPSLLIFTRAMLIVANVSCVHPHPAKWWPWLSVSSSASSHSVSVGQRRLHVLMDLLKAPFLRRRSLALRPRGGTDRGSTKTSATPCCCHSAASSSQRPSRRTSPEKFLTVLCDLRFSSCRSKVTAFLDRQQCFFVFQK